MSSFLQFSFSCQCSSWTPPTSSKCVSSLISFSSNSSLIGYGYPARSTIFTPSSLQIRAAPCFCSPVPAREFCARASLSSKVAAGVKEVLPPSLTSTSDPPPVFDGTTRLYIAYICPFAQRVWITRNCKGLQDQIKLVPIDLQDRPAWFKEKINPANKVPCLEHNNEIKVESLDLIKYIDSNFEGPSLFPGDSDKREFAEELFLYTDSFTNSVFATFRGEEKDKAAAAFDEIEKALSKFNDGPFFLGQFSLVDIAYAPFIERFSPYLQEVMNTDITEGRPKLASWIKEMEKNENYIQTRSDLKGMVERYKKRFGVSG
ncbi:hypothetical protein SAY86_009798 [Trapa natans]|uniref:glutathione transferase n=1 Tax=Trapa natans TaxID=22666 RepID=A0AAN7L2C0_TRANT|nr:hypothetical protein SAY86_009798 [Trapa natans]